MDRVLKIESRKRGAAKRHVQVQDFNIGADASLGREIDSSGDSLNIKQDRSFNIVGEESHSGSSARRGRVHDDGNIGTNISIGRPNEEVSTPINISPTNYDDYVMDAFNDHDIGIGLDRDEPIFKQDPYDEVHNAFSLPQDLDVKPKRAKQARRSRTSTQRTQTRKTNSRRQPQRRASSFKLKESFSDTESNNSSGNDSDFIYTKIDDSQDNIAIKGTRRTASASKNPRRVSSHQRKAAPVPLTSSTNKTRQKPLMINLERFVSSNKKEKRPILNTVDVLKQMIEDYNPTQVGSNQINGDQLQKEFKTHVLDHLKNLSDMNLSLTDLKNKIKEVKRLKNEYRSKTFELKKDHIKVGDELNVLRQDYSANQQKSKTLETIYSQILSMRTMMNNQDSNKDIFNENTNSSQALQYNVDNKLASLSKVMNPHLGVLSKLHQINSRLSELESHLP